MDHRHPFLVEFESCETTNGSKMYTDVACCIGVINASFKNADFYILYSELL